jgi:diphthamide synthase (EF-2-diphthine--ammonia ligase)
MASINTQINLISQAMMMNNSEQELDKLDELKSAHSIHDAVEKGNFETFKVSYYMS